MTEMAESAGASVSRPKPKFEVCLLGSIGDDSSNNGMQFIVPSALATRNVDPWRGGGQLDALADADFGMSAIHLITPLSCRASFAIRSRMNCDTRASDDRSV